MKVGIVSDIHGNDLAVEAVLNSARKLGVERILNAGDMVGYYFNPVRVLELLSEWNLVSVRGNHEDMLMGIVDNISNLSKIEKKYGSGLRVAKETLSSEQLNYLKLLPEKIVVDCGESCKVLLCHGSPWDTDQYIYPDVADDMLEKFNDIDVDIIVMGHTHYPMKRAFKGCLLLNPGSVGQPRNRKPGASWAILDTDAGSIELRHEAYDVEHVAIESRFRHPELPYLADVLTRI